MHLQAWHIRAGVRAGSRGGGSARCVPAFPLGVVGFFFYVLPTQTKTTLFKKGWWGGGVCTLTKKRVHGKNHVSQLNWFTVNVLGSRL